MKTHVIVLSAHNIALGLVRSLGRAGIPAIVVSYEKSDMAHVSRYVKQAVPAPHPEQSEPQFLDAVMNVAKRYPGSIIMPADDATLVAASRNKQELERFGAVACPAWGVVERLIDKKYTYELAHAIGVPAPKTLVPGTLRQVRDYASDADYPCLVKPCQSHRYYERFRKKLVKVHNADQLAAAYIEAADAGMAVMLQEFIPGDDTSGVNYNSYFRDGRPLAEFTAEKVRISPPESGVPAVVVSKHLPQIIPSGRRMLEALQFSGYSCMEFKKDARDGVYKLMEVNPRHNRSLLLAVACGVNFPVIEYEHRLYGTIPSPQPFREGYYWIDGFRDMAAVARYRRLGKFSPMQYVRPYLMPHISATFSITDPLPFLKRCADMARMARRAASKPRVVRRPESRREPPVPATLRPEDDSQSHTLAEPVLAGRDRS